MVAPIRELVNITLSTTTKAHITNNMALIQDIDMVVDSLDNLFNIGNNFNKVRGCSLVLSTYRPRSLSISSSECGEEYYVWVKRESNRINEDKPITSIGSIQIEYVTQKRKNDQVSKISDNTNNASNQRVPNEDLVSSLPSSNNMFNVQLSYDIDQALDPEF